MHQDQVKNIYQFPLRAATFIASAQIQVGTEAAKAILDTPPLANRVKLISLSLARQIQLWDCLQVKPSIDHSIFVA